ncbi:MAG: TetR/AcrR family transcriptional regulator C-terminal domain-containing protein [Spirochaetales bacterium]|nr:TetR/AcrR family transcriptional regulator C-terminal domain-containing protein [Spirochaetales bacterium]
MSDLTKKALAQTLKDLMRRQTLDKITVKELSETCGVNRQTFYYHFQDIYDLLIWIYRKDITEPLLKYRSYSRWKEGITLVFKYMEENKPFCLNTYRSLGKAKSEMFLNNIAFDCLRTVVEECSENSPLSSQKKDFIARFYGDGFTGLVIRWLESGANESGYDLIENLCCLLDGDFSRAIKKMSS